MNLTSWHSYPKVYNLGHRVINDLLNDQVIVEEKLDGSQFSFGRFVNELKIRSKGAIIDQENPDKLFASAVEYVRSITHILEDGWTYRGEVISKPRHNALTYNRTPDHNIVIFDVNTGEESYLDYKDKIVAAGVIGLEVTPMLFEGKIDDVGMLHELMNTISFLGGPKIEGIVVKNYLRFGPDGKALMGKYVSEEFK